MGLIKYVGKRYINVNSIYIDGLFNKIILQHDNGKRTSIEVNTFKGKRLKVLCDRSCFIGSVNTKGYAVVNGDIQSAETNRAYVYGGVSIDKYVKTIQLGNCAKQKYIEAVRGTNKKVAGKTRSVLHIDGDFDKILICDLEDVELYLKGRIGNCQVSRELYVKGKIGNIFAGELYLEKE